VLKKTLAVKAEEQVKVTENLNNYKLWFNGMKKFLSIRIK
jgi:ribosomal protein L31E